MTNIATIVATLRSLVGGESGRHLDDPIVRAVTEGRLPGEGYSSCADGPHAFRFLCGLRHRVNRREAGSHQYGARTMAWLCEPGRVGRAIGHPCASVPRATTRFNPGDTIILEVGNSKRTHTCLVLEQGPTELVSADYGQHPMRGQRPEHIACRVVRRSLTARDGRLWAGDRPIDSWLPLKAELAWAAEQGTLREPLEFGEWLTQHGAATLAPTRPTLRQGSGYSGGAEAEAVRLLQTLLGGIAIDGRFGPVTEVAVKAFQLAHDLVVDGVVGPRTWGAIERA